MPLRLHSGVAGLAQSNAWRQMAALPRAALAARQNCFRMSSKNKHSRSVYGGTTDFDLAFTPVVVVAASRDWRPQCGDGRQSTFDHGVLDSGLQPGLGLKHALGLDHLAAVLYTAIEHKSLIGSSLVGAVWGVGHTLSLLLAGLVGRFCSGSTC